MMCLVGKSEGQIAKPVPAGEPSKKDNAGPDADKTGPKGKMKHLCWPTLCSLLGGSKKDPASEPSKKDNAGPNADKTGPKGKMKHLCWPT